MSPWLIIMIGLSAGGGTGLLRWWIGSANGKDYVVTNNPERLPYGATSLRMQKLPSRKQLDMYRGHGLNVKVKTDRDN